MTLYGYELPVSMPSIDVYDTDLMKAYIAGVKEQYDQRKNDLKDFVNKYSDFYSPVDGANEAFYNMTLKKANDMLDRFYAEGRDPFKSAEGGADIQRFINGVDVSKINQLKQQAKNYQTYLEAAAKKRSEGKLDKDFEDWYLTEQHLNNFKALDKFGNVREWNLLSPPEQNTVHDITKTEFDHLEKDQWLGNNPDRGADAKYYDLKGVKDDVKNNAIDAAIVRMQNDPFGRYTLEKLKNYAESTDLDYNKVVRDYIEKENAMYLQPKEEKNDLAFKRYEESQLNYRAKLAHGGNDKEKDEPMRPFHASTTYNIDRISSGYQVKTVKLKNGRVGVITKFQQAQTDIMKKASNLPKEQRAQYILDSLSGTDYTGGFKVMLSRVSADKDDNTVFIQLHDLDKLKTAQEVLHNSVGISELKGQKFVTGVGSSIRSKLKKDLTPKVGEDAVNHTMTYTGKVINIEKEGGRIHSYLVVDVQGAQRMYYEIPKTFTDGEDGFVYENDLSNVGTNQADMARAVNVEKQKNEIKTSSY